MYKTKATAIEAIKAYPWALLRNYGLRAMDRQRPWNRGRFKLRIGISYDNMSLSNKLYLIGSKRSHPWFSRYPTWAKVRGYSCGCGVQGGGKCEISGLGHPGPHRLNPKGTPWPTVR